MLKKDRYRQLRARYSESFNCCFYCGCVATEWDYAPPLKYVDYYLITADDADFYKIPACYECEKSIRNKRIGTLEARMAAANKSINKTYQRAIRVYNMWQPQELAELDYELHRSISAGLTLGQEASERIAFNGFDYEVDGDHCVVNNEKVSFYVFQQRFDSFREALDFASKSYRIPKAKLNDLFCRFNNNFTAAIEFEQQQQFEKVELKRMKQLCRHFSNEHKQNLAFVIRTVELFMKNDDSLSIELALNKLHKDYIA